MTQRSESSPEQTARIYKRPSRLQTLGPGVMISLALLVILVIIFFLKRA